MVGYGRLLHVRRDVSLADLERVQMMLKLLTAIEAARDDAEVLAVLETGEHRRPLPQRGWPAMTTRETRMMLHDADQKRHWLAGRWHCWCKVIHSEETPGLKMIPPPWDAARYAS
jgi:hypothetical protein